MNIIGILFYSSDSHFAFSMIPIEFVCVWSNQVSLSLQMEIETFFCLQKLPYIKTDLDQ